MQLEYIIEPYFRLPQVRFAALGCLEQLAEKVGEEYMTLLPETIPFLAELMEGQSPY